MVGMVQAVVEQPTGGWPDRVRGEWTVEMLESLPDDGLRYEIIDGTLLVSPSPRPGHQAMLVGIVRVLLAACPPELQVFVAPLDWQPDGRTSLEPDLLVIRRDRVFETRIGDPELVIEIASPSSRRIDRLLKFDRYAEGGIGQYWLVEPAGTGRAPSVQVFDLVDGEYRLTGQATGGEPLRVSGPLALTIVPEELAAG